MTRASALLLCVLPLLRARAAAAACVGTDGAGVDWWLVVKAPDGLAAGYLDSSTTTRCPQGPPCWRAIADINAAGPLNSTLLALKQPGAGWLIYNDKDSNATEHWPNAHAKGVLAFSTGPGAAQQGSTAGGGAAGGPAPAPAGGGFSAFWLTHSLPMWPSDPGERPGDFAQVRHPQQLFAQHLFCVSLDAAGAEAVAAQLLVARPYVFSARLLPDPELLPSARLLANRSFCRNCTHSTAALSSRGGVRLTLFTKSPSFRWG
jgi:hypothetical protein